MASNLNYKQVANVERRTWDLEAYKKRAVERVKNEKEGGNKKNKVLSKSVGPQVNADELKEEFQPAARGAAGPERSERAYLKARRQKVDVDSKIGSVEIINPEAASTTKSGVGGPSSIKAGVTKSGVGWHCKVCDCFLRDSHTYLDHINGRKHQKNLGFSMRVERSSKDQVSARLALLAKEKERKDKSVLDESTESFGDLVKAKDAEEMRRKEERAKQRKERKKMKALHSPQEEADDEESEVELKTVPESTFVPEELEEEEEEVNPDLAAMMGFSGFK